MEYIADLQAKYDLRNDFYKKAKLYRDKNIIYLKSYNTLVAEYNTKTNKIKVYGWYSQTTARHINEFLELYGFDKATKEQMNNKEYWEV